MAEAKEISEFHKGLTALVDASSKVSDARMDSIKKSVEPFCIQAKIVDENTILGLKIRAPSFERNLARFAVKNNLFKA